MSVNGPCHTPIQQCGDAQCFVIKHFGVEIHTHTNSLSLRILLHKPHIARYNNSVALKILKKISLISNTPTIAAITATTKTKTNTNTSVTTSTTYLLLISLLLPHTNATATINIGLLLYILLLNHTTNTREVHY